MRDDQPVRVYEEYASSTEKHRAQRGAKRGKPTGRARGYIFVIFTPWGAIFSAVAPVYELDPGSDAVHMMATTGVSWVYLHKNCRRVGKKYLPEPWASYLKRLENPDA